MTLGPDTPYRTPDAPPKTRLPLLEKWSVKTPCKVSWESMVGDDRMRFCCTCSKNVYDLSAMTEDEAEAFLAVHLDDEDACVRLYRRSDGRLLTMDCPVGAKKRHRAKVALAASAAAITITSVAAVAGDVHVPRAHSTLRSSHSRFEPPRPVPNGPIGHTALPLPAEAAEAYATPPLPRSFDGTGQAEALEPAWYEDATPVPRPWRELRSPTLRQGSVQSSGPLPPEVITRIVRQNFGRFRLCYENGLRSEPALHGRVVTSFVIRADGSVANVADGGSDLPNKDVVACIARSFQNLSFPNPENGGVVKVSYPVIFHPGD